MKRTFVATALAGCLLILGFAASASAGGNSTLPSDFESPKAGPCGSSYTHVGHYPITSSGTTLGYFDVYWSSSDKRNCLVTNHSEETHGTSLYTQATIRPSGSNWPGCPSSAGCDGDHYSFYAGPVYTPAGVDMSQRCLDITGGVDWAERTMTKIHCG